jgi:hypothetical protein
MNSKLILAMGITKAVISVAWVLLGVVGMVYGVRGFNWLEGNVVRTFNEVQENIDLVATLLTETVDVFGMVDQSMSTVERSAIEAALATGEITPIIGKTSQIVSDDIPQALDNVQASLPSVIQAATAIEQTLYLLSKFQFTIPMLFGDEIKVGLGVNYDPEVPLDMALTNLGDQLVGIPDKMRNIEEDLEKTEDNLLAVSENLLDVARDVDYIREQVSDINPVLVGLMDNLDRIQTYVHRTQDVLPGKLQTAEKLYLTVLALMVLSQVPNIFFSIQICTQNCAKSLES